MDFKSIAFECAFLASLALVCSGTSAAGPESPTAMSDTAQLSTSDVRHIQATLKEALPLYKAVTKNARKEHEHGKLSVVHLIVIIGKVLAPIVGAIIEPLLVNVAKGITWAITYSLATGFDKPLSYEHFVPALEHHSGGGIGGGGGGGGGIGGGGGGSDEDYDHDEDYESHVPVTYSMKELPGLALQMIGPVLSESGKPENVEAVKNAERKLVGLLLHDKPTAVTNDGQ